MTPKWNNIDEIIEALAEPPKSGPLLIMYRCDQDKYDVCYAPSIGEATYHFDIGMQYDATVTMEQVAYYLKSEYWKTI